MLEKIKFLMSQAYEFLLPFIKILLSEVGQALIDASLEAVRAANSMPGATGAQKRDAAFEIIKNKMASAGVEVAARTINQAIEAAVAKVKEP